MKVWSPKDPDELLRYGYDWSPDLASDEALVTELFEGVNYPHVEAVAAAGTTLEGVQQDDTVLTVIIAGGTDGQEAAYLIRVRTSAGNIMEDTVALPIMSKVVAEFHPGGYVPPVPANLVALYPEFSGVSRQQLQYYLDRAAATVDTSWSEGDFAPARLAYAAHLLTLNGLGSSAQAMAIRDGSGEFKSMAIGPLRLERFDKGTATTNGGLASTRYGKDYQALLRRNKGGPRVAGYSGPPVPPVGGDNFGPWTA